MKPKEKAVKLIAEFQDKAIDVVQILINSYKDIFDDFICNKELYDDFSCMGKYWEAVKKEIEEVIN